MNSHVLQQFPAWLAGATVLAILTTVAPAPGAVVGGVGQRASSEFLPDGRWASNLTTGTGLVGSAHVNTPGGTMWLSGDGDATGFVEFDLGGIYSLDSLRVWNYNEAVNGLMTRGVATANIDVATTPGAYSTHLAGQPLTQAPGTETDFSQSIAMGGVMARFVRIDVLGNHGDASFTGLSEVRFDGTHVSGNKAIAATVASVSSTIAGFNRLPEYTVNHAGVFDRTHTVVPDGQMWLAGADDLTPIITYDLGMAQPLSHMLLWNYNEFLPGRADLLNRGVSNIDILGSDDGELFSALISGHEVPIAPGNNTDNFAHQIDLGGASPRFVRISVNGNHGDATFTGLSEVQFFAVPEPSSALFLLLGAGAASLFSLRRRS